MLQLYKVYCEILYRDRFKLYQRFATMTAIQSNALKKLPSAANPSVIITFLSAV